MTDTRNTTDLLAEPESITSWDHETMNASYTWSPTPPAMGGESVHARAFCLGAREGLQQYIPVPYTSWSDYSGSAVERSNCRAIREDFEDYVVHVTGGYGGEWLLLPLGVEIPEELFDAIVELHDYPLYDETDHSDLEQELTLEALDSYGLADLEHEVAQALVGPGGDTWDAQDLIVQDELTALYWDACEVTGDYPYPETATDVVLWHGDKIPEAIAEAIIAALVKIHECTGQLTLGETA